MSQAAVQEFGKWRSRLWPIHSFELKKLVPMIVMFFLILFNYTILRDVKDVLIMNSCSAAAIPFIKVWAVVPAAILFLVFYAKASNILSRPKLFYASVIPFILFFALFAVWMYPMGRSIQPVESATALAAILPEKLSVIADIYRNWHYVLFYVLSELWGSVALSLLFWGFANQTTRVSEAKRVYPLFGLFGNWALVISGPLIVFFSKISSKANDDLAFGDALYWLMGMVILGAFIIMGIYWWMNKYVLSDPRFAPAEGEVKKKKEKPKMSLMESFKYLASSKYMLCLATLVLCYGFAINLVEVTWKGQLALQYPNKTDYAAFMGAFSTVVGGMTILMMLFVGGNVMRRFGWGPAAAFTPIVLAVTGAGFFGFILFKDALGGMVALLHMTPLFVGVLFGAAQNILSKSTKYSLFDPTKEMAYIPLDEEQKVKGKAAIDVAGARLGKSGGSVVQQFLIGTIGFAAMTPYVAVIVGVILTVWIIAVRSLSRQFKATTEEKQPVEAAAPSAEPAKA